MPISPVENLADALKLRLPLAQDSAQISPGRVTDNGTDGNQGEGISRARTKRFAHRENCPCHVCVGIKERESQGLSSHKAMKKRRHVARSAHVALKAVKKIISKANDIHEVNAAVERVAENIKEQIAETGRVSVNKTLHTAGVSKRNNPKDTVMGNAIAGSLESFIASSLSRVGITDERLASVAADALEATEIKYAIQDGQFSDERETPDWSARHKFWRDLVTIKGYLAKDSPGGGEGGLVIIAPGVQVVEGHSPNCSCVECAAAWEERVKGTLKAQQRRAARAQALEGEIVESEDDASSQPTGRSSPAVTGEDEEGAGDDG